MKRALALLGLISITLACIRASASTLVLDGGVIQASSSPVEISVGEACVRSMGYWKNHPEAWPVDAVVVGEIPYSDDGALDILETPPKGDATYILAHQLIPALLNIGAGGDGSPVADTVAQADSWLTDHPLGSDPPDPERSQGISLSDTLEEFNTGQLGPESCDEDEDPDPGPDEEMTTIVLGADPMTVAADGESVVAIEISVGQDALHPTPGPVEIMLTTSLGTFAEGSTEGVVEMTGDTAQITLYAGMEPGNAMVTAMLDGSTAQVIIEFTEPVPPPPEQGTPTPEATDRATPLPTEGAPSSEPTATEETPTPSESE